MKNTFSFLVVLIIIISVVSGLMGEFKSYREDFELEEQILQAIEEEADFPVVAGERSRYVFAYSNRKSYPEKIIRRVTDKYSLDKRSATLTWRFRTPETVALSSMGVDERHHYVNDYLESYAPFVTDKIWVPFYTVAMRLSYQLDSQQYGYPDVWQTSREAFFNTRGDCEDHALILADWLIDIGIDARVVLGKYNGGGHAWVVAIQDGETFLLEATSKRKMKQWQHYPLATFSSGYNPSHMFNRKHLWVNKGELSTKDYSGTHWKKVSKYVEEVM